MPVKGSKDMDKYKVKEKQDTTKEYNDTIRCQLEASERYDRENVDNIRLRVPKGWREQMQEYVKKSNKYKSVNAMICDLIKNEVGITEKEDD